MRKLDKDTEAKRYGYQPVEPFPGWGKTWRAWHVDCGALTTINLASLKGGRRGGGCNYCSGSAEHPAVAIQTMLDAGLLPLDGYPGSHTAWRCRCMRCGTVRNPQYRHIKSGMSQGCLSCSNRSNTVEIIQERALLLGFKLVDDDVPSYANEPVQVWCRSCGGRTAMAQNTEGCPYCVTKTKIHPAEYCRVAEERGLSLVDQPTATNHRTRYRCHRCSQIVKHQYTELRRGDTNICPFCDSSPCGFDNARPAWVYVIADPEDKVRKVGISNYLNHRLAAHRAQGLTSVLKVLGPMPGGDARLIEREWLSIVRAAGAGQVEIDLRYGGHTETWATAEFNALPTLVGMGTGC